WSTSKTPSYTKSVSWQHHLVNQFDQSVNMLTGRT
ncbi:transposase, partial [Escherichia coli]